MISENDAQARGLALPSGGSSFDQRQTEIILYTKMTTLLGPPGKPGKTHQHMLVRPQFSEV